MASSLTSRRSFLEASRAAEGATSVVFRVTLESGILAACKVSRGHSFDRIVEAEASRLCWLDGARVPELLGVGRWEGPGAPEGSPFLLTRWVSGAVLPRGITGPSSRRLELASRVACDLGEALASLERVGVSHGDVKPENVLLCTDEGEARAHLVDFGLGGEAGSGEVSGGTVRYLAPEARSGEVVERRFLDRYALGVLLAELLSPEAARSADPAGAFEASGDGGPLRPVVLALLARSPLSRPGPWHVAQAARALLGERAPLRGDEGLVKAAYAGVRRASLLAAQSAGEVEAGSGLAPWAPALVERLRAAGELAGAARTAECFHLEPLAPPGLVRWLSSLVGPAASSWPLASLGAGEGAIGEALLGLAGRCPPRALTFDKLRAELSPGGPSSDGEPPPPDEPSALALLLSRPRPDERALAAVEALASRGAAPPSLHAALVDALRRGGEPERALLHVSPGDAPEVLSAGAEAARRVRDLPRAEALGRAALEAPSASPPVIRRARALLARVRLDRGEAAAALEMLPDGSTLDPASAEVRALALSAQGALDRARAEAEAGLSSGPDDEARARLSGTAGYVAHARGDAAGSLACYREAAAAASRAGAAVEEATYRTGEAAAAVDAGELAQGMEAASRAVALWESLGRRAEAARALLTWAAGLRICGALGEARQAALDAISCARLGGDERAEGYASLVEADASPGPSPSALSLAESRLASSPADALRVRARQLSSGALGDEATFACDREASRPELPSTARLEWWVARAERHLAGHGPGRRQDSLSALLSLETSPAPLELRGRACHAGRRLAIALGDGAASRRLSASQRALALRLLEGCPPEHRASLLSTPWVAEGGLPGEAPGVSGAQLGEILALVRALSTRDRLRPLLDQILDALIVWTGVERGLLLMPAPNGKLKPRAARNLSRDDLRGEQLALSQSLAARAMAEGRPVVAVDAAGESHDTYASAHALKLRSVLAVPLMARGSTLGVAYLDDRHRRGAFGPDEVAWVGLLAGIAAVALADARDQVLLRRAARKARRAQEALSAALARREAELDAVERSLAQASPKRSGRFQHEAIVGTSEPLEQALGLVDRVAPTDVPVLLLGETGSGKELFARAIHESSRRAQKRFLSENCASIPEPLLESTLFGHAKGAFTGAVSARAGLFELADKGTLFLDELGEMSVAMQTKLLRVLQDGDVRPVGGAVSRKVDVRVIAATHRDLAQMVKEGSFREDLYYRLRVLEIRIPALRDRPSDVPLLVQHFIQKHAPGQKVRVSPQAMERLVSYPWPGNVRQLENVVRRALVLSDGVIDRQSLPPELFASPQRSSSSSLNLKERVDALEADLIREALARTRGNQSRAAEVLGLSRFGLQKMLKRLQITY